MSTLRGHADSVNSVSFLSYSNTLLTASADKTVSLWDLRTVRVITSLTLVCIVVCRGCV